MRKKTYVFLWQNIIFLGIATQSPLLALTIIHHPQNHLTPIPIPLHTTNPLFPLLPHPLPTLNNLYTAIIIPKTDILFLSNQHSSKGNLLYTQPRRWWFSFRLEDCRRDGDVRRGRCGWGGEEDVEPGWGLRGLFWGWGGIWVWGVGWLGSVWLHRGSSRSIQ